MLAKREDAVVCVCFCFVCVYFLLNISFGVSKGNEIKATKATIPNFIHFDTISEQSEQHGLYPHRCRRSFWVQERYTSRHPVFQHHPILTRKTTVFSWCMLMMGIHGIFEGTNLISLCFFFQDALKHCQLHSLKPTNSLPLKIGLPNPSSNYQFSGALAVSFREGIIYGWHGFFARPWIRNICITSLSLKTWIIFREACWAPVENRNFNLSKETKHAWLGYIGEYISANHMGIIIHHYKDPY